MNKPMPFEQWREQIKIWVKMGQWDLVKLSAKKRREYEDKDTPEKIFGIKE